MLSLLLITATLAVQYPQPAPTAPKSTARTSRSTQVTPRDTKSSPAAISRTVFHDRMRELWSDHIAYTRMFIISAGSNLADTADVAQRLLRNQDEIGEAVKPYVGDAGGSQLASLLRNHIAWAAKTLIAAKGNAATTTGMKQDSSNQYISNNMYGSKSDTAMRMRDTTQVNRINSQYPTQTGRAADTTKVAKAQRNRPTTNARAQGDTANTKVPNAQYGNVRTDTTANPSGNREYAQGQNAQVQTTVDSATLKANIAGLRANADSIAALLASTKTKGWSEETLKGALQMHLDLLLQEATSYLKKDWSASIAAYDESQRQAMQMADMLSDGIIKHFPSRFTNKATTVSSR